ncbi:hypothetical protein RND81_02G153300 [Saponaria officinalis]|uniref:Reverse transcriptase zinc-binding domain-containing protein n=1 Tax=Saponaria officinalis TaxID=3572 RepID=A0AAW1MN21_SAPOF
MFCKGDKTSVMLMLRAFQTFSEASGLKMNGSKSNIYCNGVDDGVIRLVEEATGMKCGGIPFRYLGVCISPKRLGISDCERLVDKVTARITLLGSKKLSYAGRLVLIKAVYSTLHNYWARIFILPKNVLNRIDAICRKFLWHGNDSKESPPLVAWDTICQPKRLGGLGLKKLHLWNIAALGKYVWWIEKKSDHLWVKWVHAIYIKDKNWMEFVPSASASWSWRKICWVKDMLKPWLAGCSSYSVKLGYSWLCTGGTEVPWHCCMRNRFLIPKHSFFCWLIAHQHLLTQDRLMQMRITQRNYCFLCADAAENHSHLFFLCIFSRKCLFLVFVWFQTILPDRDVFVWFQTILPDRDVFEWWINCRMKTLMAKKVIVIGLASLMYHIWWSRNQCRLEGFVNSPENVFKKVQDDVRSRINICIAACKSWKAKEWIHLLLARD